MKNRKKRMIPPSPRWFQGWARANCRYSAMPENRVCVARLSEPTFRMTNEKFSMTNFQFRRSALVAALPRCALASPGTGGPCQSAALQSAEMKTEKCEKSLFALSQSEPAAVQVLPTMTPSSSVAVSSSQLQPVAVIISRIPSRSAHGVSSKAGWSRRLVPQEPWRRRMPLVLSRGCSTGVIFPNRLGGLNCWLISDRF